jgi:hypothetical protein
LSVFSQHLLKTQSGSRQTNKNKWLSARFIGSAKRKF